ncbi:MAG: hypothetical protein AB8B80_04460 [Marinicellaceae bacterium]
MKNKSCYALMLLLSSSAVFSAATFNFNYGDGPAEGFNDTGPILVASTAPGANIGEQRRASFEAAINYWGILLISSQTIIVDAEMNPQSCSSSGAVLGSAGASTAHKNFTGALVADTWYPQALANKQRGSDNDGSSDIGATFNSDIDNNPNCLGDGMTNSVNWFYATSSGGAPANTVSFYDTVLHEVGHGLGVASFVNETTGEYFGTGFGQPDIDIYSSFLEDHSTGETWGDAGMTNAERVTSAIDSGDLHWVGPAVTAEIGTLTAGVSDGHVRMYAPSPLELGSSVSHFDTVVNAAGTDELMEPSATGNEAILITDELLEDIGWGAVLPVELMLFEIE